MAKTKTLDSDLRLLMKMSYELANKVIDPELEELCTNIKSLIEDEYPLFDKILKIQNGHPEIKNELEEILHEFFTG